MRKSTSNLVDSKKFTKDLSESPPRNENSGSAISAEENNS